ncbi:MAG: hypothetical protein L3J29_06335 [Cyclobacteriaceae bacterium]|nr:hypothetical protein [Cyclobacteriaceae bacterium]
MTNDSCKKCGSPLLGRIDKQFCDAYCRNAFNNNVKRTEEKEIIAINSKLRKNRRILKTLSPVGKSTVRKEVMIAMGYDFNIFSSMYRASKNNIYYLCYEYGFSPIVNSRGVEKAVIINKQSYMGDWKPWKYVHA